MNFSVKPMKPEDIAYLKDIEREAFPENRSSSSLDGAAQNPLSAYLVLWECAPLQVNEGDLGREVAIVGLGNALIRRAQRLIGRDNVNSMQPGIDVNIGGYVGIWFPLDEAHINSIAVREPLRGRGLGEMLLISAIELAQTRGCNLVTLEVRISNTPARKLYEKYGFRELGFRKAYYLDNNEDALIMTTDNIQNLDYRQAFERLVYTFRESRSNAVRVLRS